MWRYNHTISSEEEQYLMHYGVKGMKWKKRKAVGPVGPQYNTPAAQRQMRSMQLPQVKNSQKTFHRNVDYRSRHNQIIANDPKLRRREKIRRVKNKVRSGVNTAKSKADQAVSTLKSEINKRKRISAAKRTAKKRLKKYKNSTLGYDRRIK